MDQEEEAFSGISRGVSQPGVLQAWKTLCFGEVCAKMGFWHPSNEVRAL